MKKILSTVLAVGMVASLSTLAFADTITGATGTDAKDVTAQYQAGGKSATIYSVDVVWDSMQFTYTAANEGTWNPKTHEYGKATTKATWDGNGTIAVTNHSNAGIAVTLAYTATDDAITGSFDDAKFNLATAVDTATDAAPSASAELTLLGELADTYDTFTKVGSVTVTIDKTPDEA